MKGIQKVIGIVGISIPLILSIVGFGHKESNQPSQLPKVTIAVSTTPLSAPFYIAKVKGFFKIAGVDVSIKEIPGGKKCFEALQRGEVDLATTSKSVIMFNSFNKANFSVLTSFVESDNDIKIVTLTKSKITTAEDLTGRTVGIVKGSASEYFLHSWLTSANIDPTTVKTRAYAVKDMPAALNRGEVDAISVWEPFAYKSMQLNSESSIVPTEGQYKLSFNLVHLTNNPIFNQPPQNVVSNTVERAILEGLNKATHFIQAHPEDAQLILRRHLKLSQDFIDWVWVDYQFKLSLNTALIHSLDKQAQWAIDAGLVEQQEVPNYLHFISPEALKRQ
jgi:NitT/TauT family transport system substrate-binding protein